MPAKAHYSPDLLDLRDLVLVNGTINKRALTEAIYYDLYRNFLLVIVQLFFAVYWNGQDVKVFTERNSTFYVAYTVLPTLATGIFFKAFTAEEIKANPEIYNVCIIFILL